MESITPGVCREANIDQADLDQLMRTRSIREIHGREGEKVSEKMRGSQDDEGMMRENK